MADDYEPYEHRTRPHSSSYFESLINLIKGILGTGILAMPQAFLNAGLVIGTVFTIVITIIITYCLHLLFNAMYVICKLKKVPQINYPDTLKEALLIGPECSRKCAIAAPYIINGFILFSQIGAGCIYMIFIAKNVKDVIDINTPKEKHLSIQFYVTIFVIPLLLITYIRNLKKMVPISIFANLITIIGLVIIYYYIFRKIEPIEERKLFAEYKTIPLFIGTVSFAVASVGVVLSVEQNMTNPKLWGGCLGVLNQGIFFVTILNVLTGFSGYWKYGDNIQSSITLNLDGNEPLAWATRVAFVLAIFISYALQIYPATEIIWEQYVVEHMSTSEHILFWDYVIRTCIVLTTYLLSVAIPRLGLFISLFGAFCISIIAFIIPPIIDLCIHFENGYGCMKYIFIRDFLLILFGFSVCVIGTGISIYEIVISFEHIF